jgi:hypothetical protein
MLAWALHFNNHHHYFEMNEMLSLRNQKSNVDYIFTKKLLNEIISQREVVIIAEYDFDESNEIDESQIDKIYQSL